MSHGSPDQSTVIDTTAKGRKAQDRLPVKRYHKKPLKAEVGLLC